MKQVTVYRVDYVRKTKEPIGHVVERRRRDRGDNIIGLLRLARKTFAKTPEEELLITVDRDQARLD